MRPYLMKKIKVLEMDLDVMKVTVRRLNCMLGVALVAVVVMGAFLIRITVM